ncbi:MAG: FAD-dependent oxidoreductase [Spirochaetaceae bacterium]|nr:FAD-dependent oxidoreductase [Spirochaetaceae bacterium]
MDYYDIIIVGSGPAGMGCAFTILKEKPSLKILILDKNKYSTGGMRNDCKMNFTYPIGFPLEYWEKDMANSYLEEVTDFFKPNILEKRNIERYQKRASRLGCQLISIKQTHLGTDGGLLLIKDLLKRLDENGVELALEEEMLSIDQDNHNISTNKRVIKYDKILIAPGRQGFHFLQETMKTLNVPYIDNIVDIGVRIETKVEHYSIVKDYYDPKFYFPEKVRTFCTNSGRAHVVKEKYTTARGDIWYSVNGHAYSNNLNSEEQSNLVNFAILKTVKLTAPLASGQQYAENLGVNAYQLGGGQPLMQRVGDFRLGSRSHKETFNDDPYNFKPSLEGCTPSDISLAMPAKILRGIWKAMKDLDTIVPGILHPSTIMYYPEIKLYANKPTYLDDYFKVAGDIYFAGDGAGTSRGITGAWASGIRVARGMIK